MVLGIEGLGKKGGLATVFGIEGMERKANYAPRHVEREASYTPR